MHYGRNARLHRRSYRHDELHVGRWSGQLEEFSRALDRDRACERAEFLPMLDACVDRVAHFGLERCSENAAVAQGSRPVLHLSLDPCNDLPMSQARCRGGAWVSVDDCYPVAVLADRGLDGIGCCVGAGERSEARLLARTVASLEVDVQRGAQCASVIV